MDLAEKNDIVTIHYTIKYTNGTLYDTTDGKDPITFKIGQSPLMPFFEKLIIGMAIGDIKTITLQAKNAFGENKKNLIKSIDINTIPDHIEKEVGNKVEIQQPNTHPIKAIITDIQKTHITIDANIPPIGKDLLIKIELLDLESDAS